MGTFIIDPQLASRKTLVICPIGLGNFIMATPALKRLSQALGPENLHLLALKPGIRLMGGQCGWFSTVHSWDPDHSPLFKGAAMLWRLRKENFQYSISLFPTAHWKFSLFAYLIGAGVRIGFNYSHTAIPKQVQMHSRPVDPRLHDAEQNLALICDCLNINPSGKDTLRYPLSPCRGLSAPDTGYYVCHPGSSLQRGMSRKRLPAEQFIRLIRKIHETFGLQCVLMGGPEEQPLRDTIKIGAENAVLSTYTSSLNELGEYIRGSRFYLGNDSGLMHMAAALEKKCIVFFGPSDEVRTGPYYLPGESRAPGTAPSRGHLIIRHPDEMASEARPDVNPRMRRQSSTGLQRLDSEYIWGLVEPFIRLISSEFRVQSSEF